MMPKRNSDCHPERSHFAKGMCKSCYNKDKWHNDPDFRARRLAKERRAYARNPDKKRAYGKQWYSNNKDKARAWKLKQAYGLTPDGYQMIYDHQNGLCAICGNVPPTCVDHSHQTGYLRGLLCSRCNLFLGHYEKNEHMLDKFKAYLNATEFLK